jgi:hypothetical protein
VEEACAAIARTLLNFISSWTFRAHGIIWNILMESRQQKEKTLEKTRTVVHCCHLPEES